MAERPILFSAPMVRAILAGTKTQTRRVVKDRKDPDYGCHMSPGEIAGDEHPERLCPYGQPGDRLWVRETWMDLQGTGVEGRDRAGKRVRYAYGADTPPGSYGDESRKDYGLKWRPSIHMHRWASRITLEVAAVRVERLQAISIEDAKAEGAWGPDCSIVGKVAEHFGIDEISVNPRWAFRMLWESINGPGSWAANPWVWVVGFKRQEPAHG